MILSFSVSNSNIAKLADFLRKYDKENGYFKSFESVRELAKALYDLNVWAIKIQTEDYQDYISPFEFSSEVFPKTIKGLVQAFVVLNYFLTQCWNTKEAILYQKLEKIETRLARDIAFIYAEKIGVA